MEVAVGLTPIRQLAINANMALLDAQFDDLIEGKGTRWSPVRQPAAGCSGTAGQLWVVYMPTPRGASVGVCGMSGERFADNANTVREPSYTLLDAFVSYTPWRFANFTLRGRNLTDADYAMASYGPTQFILGQPRSVEFVASLRFLGAWPWVVQ